MAKNAIFSLIIFVLLICPSYATIMDPASISSRAIGMGSAMTGTPDDIGSALYFNPAGLSLLKGSNVATGFLLPALRVRYRSPTGYNEVNDAFPQIPFFGYSTDKKRPFILGIGMYSTLGVGFEFKSDKEHGMNGKIKSISGVMFFSPTVVYEFNPDLSLGVEFNIGYGKADIDQPTPMGYLTLNSDGIGYGSTIGLLYKIYPSIYLGFSYRTPMKIIEKGDAFLDGKKDGFKLDMYIPQIINLGIAYKPSDRFTLATSLKYGDWSYFDKSRTRFDKFNFLNRHVYQDSKDTARFHIGFEYWIDDVIALRSGYMYERAALSKDWIFPGLPDMDFHIVSAGVGIKKDKLRIDIGFFYIFYVSRTVSQSKSGYPGKYSGYVPMGGFEILYEF
jgi:long-chain fatty acid transport protein